MADFYTVLKKEGKLFGTVTRARLLRRKRDKLLAVILTPDTSRVKIPPGYMMTQHIQHVCQQMYPQRRRWLPVATTTMIQDRFPDVWTIEAGRYDRNGTYGMRNYQPRIRSFGVVTPGRLCWYVGSQHKIFVAKRGWHFGSSTEQSYNNNQTLLYVCKNKFRNTPVYRFYFNGDDLLLGASGFWQRATEYVNRTQVHQLKLKEEHRIMSTKLTVNIVVQHNGVRTILQVKRQCCLPNNFNNQTRWG